MENGARTGCGIITARRYLESARDCGALIETSAERCVLSSASPGWLKFTFWNIERVRAHLISAQMMFFGIY
jgi:hypothetical protein